MAKGTSKKGKNMYRLVITVKKNGNGRFKKVYLIDEKQVKELHEGEKFNPSYQAFMATPVQQGLIFINRDKLIGIQVFADCHEKEFESPPEFEGLVLFTTHPIIESEEGDPPSEEGKTDKKSEGTDDGLFVPISNVGNLCDISNHFIDCVLNNINFDFLDDDNEDVVVNTKHVVVAEFWHRNIDTMLP